MTTLADAARSHRRLAAIRTHRSATGVIVHDVSEAPASPAPIPRRRQAASAARRLTLLADRLRLDPRRCFTKR